MEIQLEDMLETYNSIYMPQFQKYLSAKQEFREMASVPNEKLPKGPGKYYKHQIFMLRFLRAYDDIMIISGTGSGKSCEILAFIEYCKKQRDKELTGDLSFDEKAAHFKKTIILVKGQTQKNEIRNQIICKCSDGSYLTRRVKNAKSETDQKRALTDELKKAGYIVTTYTSFANKVRKYENTPNGYNRMVADFSDTIFWIDEAHNLLVEQDKNLKQDEKTEKIRTYQTLHLLLHSAKRCKRIISTATPMLNDPTDLTSLFNLILPEDGKLPPGFNPTIATDNDIRVLFPDLTLIEYNQLKRNYEELGKYFKGQIPADFDYENANLEDVEPYFRGRIGYIRAADTGAQAKEIGDIVNIEKYSSKIIVYKSYMSDFQKQAYDNLSRQSKKAFGGSLRQASNFVFPDGSWGGGSSKVQSKVKPEDQNVLPIFSASESSYEDETDDDIDTTTTIKGFSKYVTVNGDNFTAKNEFKKYISNLESIRILSCKYASIIELSMNANGNVFVYGEYVQGSGAIVLGLCYEQMGFERFEESTSIFESAGGNTKPYCGNSTTIKKDGLYNRRVKIEKKMRYALLTRDTSESKFHAMMEAMNSYENRYGEYIKVLISSRVGRDGINVNNVVQIHLVGGEWNQSAIYQAISRGLRATSHEDILEDERQRLISLNKDPRTAKVSVDIYKHAAVPDDNTDGYDIHMYKIAAEKDRRIRRIMRMMKQTAIGCQIHYNRNVRPDDIDYTDTCDYDICKYECSDPFVDPNLIDYSTYNVHYTTEMISNIIQKIAALFRVNTILSFNEILTLLDEEYKGTYVLLALEKIISNKIPLVDRFGFTVYLYEDDNIFFIDRNYPFDDNESYLMSYYNNGIIATDNTYLSKFMANINDDKIIEYILRLGGGEGRMRDRYTEQGLTVEILAKILEYCISKLYFEPKMEGDSQYVYDIMNEIVEDLKYYTFKIPYPRKLIESEINPTIPQPKTVGRKKNVDKISRTKPVEINSSTLRLLDDLDKNEPSVYLHTIYSGIANDTEYATVARTTKGDGTLRIYDIFENKWRDVNNEELSVYNLLIQATTYQRDKVFKDQGVYGILRLFSDKRGKYRVANRNYLSPKANSNDKRDDNRGIICVNLSRHDLIDVLWDVQFQLPVDNTKKVVYDDQNRNDMINLLSGKKIKKGIFKYNADELKTWGTDKLQYYAYATTMKYTRAQICDLLFEHLMENNKMTG